MRCNFFWLNWLDRLNEEIKFGILPTKMVISEFLAIFFEMFEVIFEQIQGCPCFQEKKIVLFLNGPNYIPFDRRESFSQIGQLSMEVGMGV